jgi:hypothetical protein
VFIPGLWIVKKGANAKGRPKRSALELG